TTIDLVGYPGCEAVAQLRNRRPCWARILPSGGGPGDVGVQAGVVLPSRCVPETDLGVGARYARSSHAVAVQGAYNSLRVTLRSYTIARRAGHGRTCQSSVSR